MSHRTYGLVAALMLGTAAIASSACASEMQSAPDAPNFPNQNKVTYVGIADVIQFKALDKYSEPDWVTKQFVETGKLPPVKDRLPKEPMVYQVGNMPDGIGVYGDTLRHVIGGRPEGWNNSAGQAQGWGGIDIAMYECLTRTGPLFQIKPEELEPMPNLAKSWEWSDDGFVLTMHLIEGAKWSDGEDFTSDDVMFYWDDNVMDPNVYPLNGASQESFGVGTTLKALDKYTVQWTFKTAFPKQFLYTMAYGTFCPGPAHLLKPQHPKYSDNTYEQFKNAFPPDFMNFPVMGAWVPVGYRPDDIIVLRRNPYYWKVDSDGNQLPYLDETQYKLSTWADRDVQAVAGSGDLSNLEQPSNFVESLKRAAKDDAPARLAFGPRLIGYNLYMNFSGNGWGDPDEREQAVRELNRNFDFRKAVTMAVDRKKLGDSLVKGPFVAEYPGGIMSGSNYYDQASTMYYPFDLEGAKALLAKAGLKDTDGDGFVNFPAGTVGGKNVEISLLVSGDYNTDKSLAEGIIAQMQTLGLRVVLNIQNGKDRDAVNYGGKFDWMVFRNQTELASVVQLTHQLAPMGPRTSFFHRANGAGELDLMPFEEEMVAAIGKFISSNDADEQVAAIKDYQKISTSNVNSVGLVQYPGALIINKRFKNVPAGAPIYMFNWAEGAIMRERLFVPAEAQGDYQLYPHTLPGLPGGAGPVK
ncbi:ABC transporter substrate-binding protein [uncultured Cohaesibacter sp.]|uniref:ABC transporter substrate-binding protein n=1 Tax=uncultured Cohaesibacter sp. TaxID=1002546 RepID=UPI00292EEBDD|nr:ABC transporter substrate-binding protein [uncultured Cohaesibacter sp.]